MDLSNELSRNPESEPDPAVMASIYGPDTSVIDRSDRLYLFLQSAFDRVNQLATHDGVLTSEDLATEFEFGAQRIPLINPQRGSFQAAAVARLLSIKTVFPRRGARVWYDDQREAHRQICAGDDVVEYQFMGSDLNSADNRWFLDAMQRQIPPCRIPRRCRGWRSPATG